ncbi:MAG: Gfo/Idh/MocA family oxidoreductase, partial [Candidatus Acidiferrum sp.]
MSARTLGKTRVVVVGCGEFGRNHARAYREMENVELAGIFDQNAERAAKIAQEFQTRAFSNIGELCGAVEAASVAVPTVAHRAVGCELMDMGIDVLVEKPMASTLADADALITTA